MTRSPSDYFDDMIKDLGLADPKPVSLTLEQITETIFQKDRLKIALDALNSFDFENHALYEAKEIIEDAMNERNKVVAEFKNGGYPEAPWCK